MADKEFQKLEDENQKKGVLGNPRKNLLFGCCQGNALLSSFMEDTSACIIGIFVVILTLYIGLFVSMITIGALAKDKCQIEPMIPIYLIVVGVTGIALVLVIFLIFLNPILCYCLAVLILLFLICWFVAGNVWVFKTYTHRDQCDKKAYYLAFWSIILSYINMILKPASKLRY
ncbi:transmembrane protein 272-like isoform X1 [Hydra vulgaris]|uniref:Transmembrane protein 272-like isoform X1 n=1 Tax=Hydra vulgaris TaxID=6087 RepID=A0ABM4B325_HYDVU